MSSADVTMRCSGSISRDAARVYVMVRVKKIMKKVEVKSLAMCMSGRVVCTYVDGRFRPIGIGFCSFNLFGRLSTSIYVLSLFLLVGTSFTYLHAVSLCITARFLWRFPHPSRR
jgi:hypothetical protein